MRFFHVDSYRTITGNYVDYLDIDKSHPLINSYGNISAHGRNYLFNKTFIHHEEYSTYKPSFIWEIMLEYTRLKAFPNLPSRFQSLFAVETEDEAIRWAKYFHKHREINEFVIYSIESDTYSLHDAAWMTYNVNKHYIESKSGYNESILNYTAFTYKYWSGEISSCPEKEVLIPLPCKIVGAYNLKIADST